MDAVIVNCINRFLTREKADEIEQFFAANPLPNSQRRISQSLELMRSSAGLLERIKTSKLTNATFWA